MSIGNHLSVDGQAFFPAMRAINNSRKGNAYGHLRPNVPSAPYIGALHGSNLQVVESSRIGRAARHLIGSQIGMIYLAERLVGAEANNGQSKGIHRQFVILDVLAENIGNAGRPALTLNLTMIRWIREHLLELNPCRIWRLSKIVENDIRSIVKRFRLK
jgi:hypothetical protein